MSSFYEASIRTPEEVASYWLVQDLNSASLLLSLLAQAFTLLHRGQAFPQMPSYSNSPVFSIVSLLCLLLHAALLAARAFLRSNGVATYCSLHWGVWVVLTTIPLGGIITGYVVNYYDNKHYRRHLQFLRLEFDTRLGMHSPR
jgi:hypothetical protein